MAYFVTGATGFIGRHLLERLLDRDGDVHVLVRESSVARLDSLVSRLGGDGRVHPVIGDLRRPRLGVDSAEIVARRGTIDHFFHLAAIYDMTADPGRNETLNVGGTEHAVELARALDAGCLHHVSSVAVAGTYRGRFREDMFDQRQKLPSAYHRTKFESERIVREQTAVPWRIYRPSLVVGHSQTGEIDKIDGPYYFFSAIKRLSRYVPDWMPLVGVDLGDTNIVPVDFVARALDRIAHQPDLDGRAFHLTNPRSQRSIDVLNLFARVAGAPQLAIRIDKRLTDALPTGALAMALELPGLRRIKKQVLAEAGIPAEVVEHTGFSSSFDNSEAADALAGSGIEVPPLADYADRLWDYWERHLDPNIHKDRSLGASLRGRTVLITGGSSGIGRATALKVAAAGGIPLLVARTQSRLEETKLEIEAAGGTAYVYDADLSDMDEIARVVDRVLLDHPRIDFLVNNAGRSIRRSVKLSYDRFHDYERTMQLNYFGAIKLIMAVLPHMQAQRRGHIVNVSSIGVQTNPPRFSAYVASKAALDAFSRVVSSEVLGDGVTFTTIHMPLVRTPMIAPTKMYDAFPAITPDEAADMICRALGAKPKHIGTRLGTLGEVSYALAPKAVDQLLHLAYNVFPDSAASKGQTDPAEHASKEQVALAKVMKGVHW